MALKTLRTLRAKVLNTLATVALVPAIMISCHTEDPGPLRDDEKSFYEEDFDRLEIGEFDIRVAQGPYFSIKARGDERNLDDLVVRKEGSTLVIRYDRSDSRKHQTYIEITMPALLEVNFSGGSKSTIAGFTDNANMRINLSGASTSQVDIESTVLNASLSGASSLTLTGSGRTLTGVLSGASQLKAFGFPVDDADLNLSGASAAKVSADTHLKAVAGGASEVRYRGTPLIDSDMSGGSSIRQD